MGEQPPEKAAWAVKSPNAVIGPGEAIRLPQRAPDRIDYEGELGIVFGRSGARPGDRALAFVGLPLVAIVFGVAFIGGFFGPNLGYVTPHNGRRRALRVLIINWRDITHPWAGGAENYMHEIGRRWVDSGLEVGWLCQRYRGSDRVETIDGIRIHRVGGRLTLYPLAVLAYRTRLRKRKASTQTRGGLFYGRGDTT